MRPVTLAAGYTRGDFDALLASRQFSYADAITFYLQSGTMLPYTNAQATFSAPPCQVPDIILRTYVASDVLVTGLKFNASTGSDSSGSAPSLAVDEQSITLYPDNNPLVPSMIDGVPFLKAVAQGALDAATIQRDRWYFERPSKTPIGGVPLFAGYTASIDQLSRTQVVLKIKSDIVLLNVQMPRNLYQPNCQYTVYSGPCGAIKANYANNAVVGASPTRSFIPWSSATAQFTSGEVNFSSGPNAGLIRTILRADTTGLTLAYPLPYTPVAGDAFIAFPGCDRTYTGGCAFFGRQASHRATPFVPGAVFSV